MEKINMKESTTEFVLRRDGEIVPLWNANTIGKFVRETIGIEVKAPGFGHYADSLLNHNTITNVGHAAANGRISNQGSYNAFVNLAIGTGTQGSPSTATALSAEITTGGGARGAASASQVTTTVTNDTTQLQKTWSFTSTFAVTEEGIFDSASVGGNMLAYQSFSTITVNNGDSLTVTHKYQS
jgi:hypothetical protein